MFYLLLCPAKRLEMFCKALYKYGFIIIIIKTQLTININDIGKITRFRNRDC